MSKFLSLDCGTKLTGCSCCPAEFDAIITSLLLWFISFTVVIALDALSPPKDGQANDQGGQDQPKSFHCCFKMMCPDKTEFLGQPSPQGVGAWPGHSGFGCWHGEYKTWKHRLPLMKVKTMATARTFAVGGWSSHVKRILAFLGFLFLSQKSAKLFTSQKAAFIFLRIKVNSSPHLWAFKDQRGCITTFTRK